MDEATSVSCMTVPFFFAVIVETAVSRVCDLSVVNQRIAQCRYDNAASSSLLRSVEGKPEEV